MRMNELSDRAIKLACAYLYNVISYAEGEKVINTYGQPWEPFEPLMNEIEEEAGIRRGKIPLWRMEVWTEFREKRLDSTFSKLGEVFELMSDVAYRRMHELASLFPPERWAEMTASAKYNVKKKEEFRIWGVDELEKMDIGAKFVHRNFGACEIVKTDSQKKMKFDAPIGPNFPVAFFTQAFPWNEEMKRVV